MNLLAKLRGITGMPDFLLRKTRWGFKWSRVGDAHDSWYGRGCPRDWADEAYYILCGRVGLNTLGVVTYKVLDWFGWWFYRPESAGEWTRFKVSQEIDFWEKTIRQEVAERWPKR